MRPKWRMYQICCLMLNINTHHLYLNRLLISRLYTEFLLEPEQTWNIHIKQSPHIDVETLLFQGVQAGRSGSGSTVISWMVDDDNSVVKYCQDNIVTIFVPGDSEDSVTDDSGDTEGAAELEIVASNTLRLRIVPCQDISGGPNALIKPPLGPAHNITVSSLHRDHNNH